MRSLIEILAQANLQDSWKWEEAKIKFSRHNNRARHVHPTGIYIDRRHGWYILRSDGWIIIQAHAIQPKGIVQNAKKYVFLL